MQHHSSHTHGTAHSSTSQTQEGSRLAHTQGHAIHPKGKWKHTTGHMGLFQVASMDHHNTHTAISQVRHLIKVHTVKQQSLDCNTDIARSHLAVGAATSTPHQGAARSR